MEQADTTRSARIDTSLGAVGHEGQVAGEVRRQAGRFEDLGEAAQRLAGPDAGFGDAGAGGGVELGRGAGHPQRGAVEGRPAAGEGEHLVGEGVDLGAVAVHAPLGKDRVAHDW